MATEMKFCFHHHGDKIKYVLTSDDGFRGFIWYDKRNDAQARIELDRQYESWKKFRWI